MSRPTFPWSDRRRTRGGGTQRERRPGVWEIRIRLGPDPVSRRPPHRSFVFCGTEAEADAHRAELVATTHALPVPPGRLIAVAELLDAWLAADHPWKPSTVVGCRSNVRALLADPIAGVRVVSLTPHQVRAVFARWYAERDPGGGRRPVPGSAFRGRVGL